MFDDPRRNLHWMNDELLREEDESLRADAPEYDDPECEWEEDSEDELEAELDEIYDLLDSEPVSFQSCLPVNRVLRFSTAVYEEDADFADGSRYIPAPRKKGIKGLVFLAFLEICAILVLLGWWFGWWA